MRIATWNVNGLRSRLDFVLHWLRSRTPDLVGLQELKLTEEQFPVDVFEAEGYHPVIHGQKAWNGVAILGRDPVEVTERGLPGQEELGARLVSGQQGSLHFVSIYAPNGKEVGHEDFPHKLAWYDRLREHIEERYTPAVPIIVGGDFNICPTSLDSWRDRGQIFHTDEERRRFQALLSWGFHDLFRERFPETQSFSWWDYRGGAFHRKQGLRIDLLLGTPAVLERVGNVEIDREYRKKKDGMIASDHAPVIVDLADE